MRHQYRLKPLSPRVDAGDARATVRRMRQVAERSDQALEDQALEDVREQLVRLTILLGQLEQRRKLAVNSLPTVTPFSRPMATPAQVLDWAYPRSA